MRLPTRRSTNYQRSIKEEVERKLPIIIKEPIEIVVPKRSTLPISRREPQTTIIKGDRGPIGPKGNQGEQGIQGEPGSNGTNGEDAQNLKALYIIDPNSTEDIVLFFTDVALDISKIVIAVTGGGDITWNVRLSSTRSAVGTTIFTIDRTTSGEEVILVFDQDSVLSNTFIRFEISGSSGTVDNIHLTLFYNLI